MNVELFHTIQTIFFHQEALENNKNYRPVCCPKSHEQKPTVYS